MSVTSSLSSEPAGMGSAKATVIFLPSGWAWPSIFTRFKPSSTVMRVDEPSKVAPSGSSSVTASTLSPSSTVPSQVRRVFMPPMTPEPPSSLGFAVALSVERPNAAPGSASAAARSAATNMPACALCCMCPMGTSQSLSVNTAKTRRENPFSSFAGHWMDMGPRTISRSRTTWS